jgi:hypothetical protein
MNNKKYLVGGVVMLIVTVAASFYGGMRYGTNKIPKDQIVQGGRNGGGFTDGGAGGQRMNGQGGQRRSGGMQGGLANGGAGDFAGGEILAKDDTSITLKSRDGGSKIVFFSDKTLIDKSVSGVLSDLTIGQQITVNGKASSDGTMTAQSIQIRPAQPISQ